MCKLVQDHIGSQPMSVLHMSLMLGFVPVTIDMFRDNSVLNKNIVNLVKDPLLIQDELKFFYAKVIRQESFLTRARELFREVLKSVTLKDVSDYMLLQYIMGG